MARKENSLLQNNASIQAKGKREYSPWIEINIAMFSAFLYLCYMAALYYSLNYSGPQLLQFRLVLGCLVAIMLLSLYIRKMLKSK